MAFLTFSFRAYSNRANRRAGAAPDLKRQSHKLKLCDPSFGQGFQIQTLNNMNAVFYQQMNMYLHAGRNAFKRHSV